MTRPTSPPSSCTLPTSDATAWETRMAAARRGSGAPGRGGAPAAVPSPAAGRAEPAPLTAGTVGTPDGEVEGDVAAPVVAPSGAIAARGAAPGAADAAVVGIFFTSSAWRACTCGRPGMICGTCWIAPN